MGKGNISGLNKKPQPKPKTNKGVSPNVGCLSTDMGRMFGKTESGQVISVHCSLSRVRIASHLSPSLSNIGETCRSATHPPQY